MYYNIEEVNKDWHPCDLNEILSPYREVFDNMEGVSPGMSIRHLFVYLVYMIDKGSPLNDVDSYREKKQEAAKLSGLIKRQGGSPSWVQEIIVGSDYVNRIKVLMMRSQYNNDWSLLMTLQSAYYTLLEETASGDTDKAKKAMELNSQINEVQKKMNGGALTDLEKMMMLRILEDENLGIRPEEHIRAYEDHQEVFMEFSQ